MIDGLNSNKYPYVNFNIVLLEPEIPMNTGNIGRTCVGTCSKLHLIRPFGFEIDDKRLRRAGLDYWSGLDVSEYSSWSDFISQVSDISRVFVFTTKTNKTLYSFNFRAGDYLVFGKETKGLPTAVRQQFSQNAMTIPIEGEIRSFNLSNAVSVALFEGVRQLHHSPK